MIISHHLNSILKDDWHKFEEIKLLPEQPLFDIETCYSGAGVLIWHILEDRIFLSEGLCRMMEMSEAGILNLELQFWMEAENEFRRYLRNILDQICSNKITDTSFKTRIPGIQKEVYGSVQLFDMEDLGIMDMVVICWEGTSTK